MKGWGWTQITRTWSNKNMNSHYFVESLSRNSLYVRTSALVFRTFPIVHATFRFWFRYWSLLPPRGKWNSSLLSKIHQKCQSIKQSENQKDWVSIPRTCSCHDGNISSHFLETMNFPILSWKPHVFMFVLTTISCFGYLMNGYEFLNIKYLLILQSSQ